MRKKWREQSAGSTACDEPGEDFDALRVFVSGNGMYPGLPQNNCLKNHGKPLDFGETHLKPVLSQLVLTQIRSSFSEASPVSDLSKTCGSKGFYTMKTLRRIATWAWGTPISFPFPEHIPCLFHVPTTQRITFSRHMAPTVGHSCHGSQQLPSASSKSPGHLSPVTGSRLATPPAQTANRNVATGIPCQADLADHPLGGKQLESMDADRFEKRGMSNPSWNWNEFDSCVLMHTWDTKLQLQALKKGNLNQPTHMS